MPIEVLMPALSPTMEKVNFAKWLKAVGDRVKSGDVIAEIETDKATMEVEAVDEGTLGQILVPEGTADVSVNTPIAVILRAGEERTARSSLLRRRSARRRKQNHPHRGKSGADGCRRACIRCLERSSRRHRNGHHDRARGFARRHGGGDAAR